MKKLLPLACLPAVLFLFGCPNPERTLVCQPGDVEIRAIGNPFTGNYDSAKVYEYQAGSNFGKLTDSLTFMAYRIDSAVDTSEYRWKEHGLRAGYDYRIYIPASQKTYSVTGLSAIGRQSKVSRNHDEVVCYNSVGHAKLNGSDVTTDSAYYDDHARVIYLK